VEGPFIDLLVVGGPHTVDDGDRDWAQGWQKHAILG
jgi:hypothetical protein